MRCSASNRKRAPPPRSIIQGDFGAARSYDDEALANSGLKAWMEGWAMPVERAVVEALSDEPAP